MITLTLDTSLKKVNIENTDFTTLSELIYDFCRILSIQGHSKRDIVKEMQNTIHKLEADEIISDIGEL